MDKHKIWYKAFIIPYASSSFVIQDRREYKKPDFGFFGGFLEADETNTEAIVRESLEELELTVSVDDLEYIGQVYTEDDRGLIGRAIFAYKLENFDGLVCNEGELLEVESYEEAREYITSQGSLRVLDLFEWYRNKDREDNLEKSIRYFFATSYGADKSLAHFERTVHWLKYLDENATVEKRIAAYAHDIQRAFRRNSTIDKIISSPDGFQDAEMLRQHQQEGADIVAKELSRLGASDGLVNKVKSLIAKHEEGGSVDQNNLKDADSISFFEMNADHFVKKFAKQIGKQKVRDKFEWMYSRITSDKAKKVAKPFYDNYLKELINAYEI